MTANRNTSIDSLTSLRFIFAIMIFTHHFTIDGEGLFPQAGAFSVAFFFILSGFALALNYEKRILNREISSFNFFMKRLTKVYPLHLLCFFAAVFLAGGTLKQAMANELLLQSWIPVESYYFSFNALSWYLSTLVFGYFMFPFCIRFFHKTGLKKSFLLFFLLAILLVISMFFCSEKYYHRFYYIFPPTRLLDFIAGIFLFYAYRYFQEKPLQIHFSKLKISIIELFSVAVFIVFVILSNKISDSFVFGIYYWIPSLCMIFAFAYFNKSGGGISHLLTNKLLVYMGNISFDFFMIHILTINAMNRIFDYCGINMIWQCKFAGILLTTCLLSYLISNFYEKPIAKFLNKNIIFK